MVARSMTLQSKAGYIDARPLTASSTKPLATHGRTIQSGHEPNNSLRAYWVRCTPNSDRIADMPERLKRANRRHRAPFREDWKSAYTYLIAAGGTFRSPDGLQMGTTMKLPRRSFLHL